MFVVVLSLGTPGSALDRSGGLTTRENATVRRIGAERGRLFISESVRALFTFLK